MRTATFCYPNNQNPDLEVEVTRDGTIVSATAYYSTFDCWLDCREELLARPRWTKWINDQIADHDWQDYADEDDFEVQSIELIKEALRPA